MERGLTPISRVFKNCLVSANSSSALFACPPLCAAVTFLIFPVSDREVRTAGDPVVFIFVTFRSWRA